jgi:nucleotide-binding universal stress UspA family protein
MPNKTGERIVVGVDGSAISRRAIQWATSHAQQDDTIEVVHTWTRPVPVAEAGTSIDPMLLADSAAAVLEAEVDFARQDCDGGIPITGRTIEGHAGSALIKAAQDADLIVVGSRGRGGFTGLLLGSTSTYLAHHVECPLVIVRSPKH